MGKNFIGVYDNIISKKECEILISLFEKSPQLDGLCWYEGEITVEPVIKQCKELDRCKFSDKSAISNIVLRGLKRCMDLYVKEYPDIEENIGSWRVEDGYCFQKYETESDGYKSWHCESSNLKTSSRLLVWSFYLNNAKSGTQFRHFRTTRAKMGRGVIFPAAWTHFHKSEPNKGLKYLITGWIKYE